MDLKNNDEIADFVDLIKDTRESGLRIFNKWTKKDPVLIKKADPKFYALLKSLSDREIEVINGIAPMILETSFYLLFEALEQGKDGLEFELLMKSSKTGKKTSLINEIEDNDIRTKIDIS